ncbi:MAG: hypothetical protein RLN60_04535 [Phycisphaerales bacterium]
MTLRTTAFALLAGIVTSVSSAQIEPHRDIQLSIVEGQINTGVVDFDTPGNPITPDVRIFTRTLGEGAIDHFTDDPGFNAFSGTFVPGTLIGFDMMDHLRRWNAAEGHFDEIPEVTMLINLGVVSINTPAESENPTFPVPGFFFASTSGSGGLHQHVNFFLNPPQTAGVYLLQLRVVSNGGELPSETVYIIFSENAAMENVEQAAMHIEGLINGAGLCAGDCDENGTVDFNDLVCTLFEFGTDNPVSDCDQSGLVDFNDLICALFAFGPCPE